MPAAEASGNLGILRSGDLEIQKFGVQKNKKMKSLKIQIRFAQSVGKVWISRKTILLAPFGAIPGHFLHGPKNAKIADFSPIFLGGPMALYSPGLGPFTNLPVR